MTIDELMLICDLPDYKNFAEAACYLPYSSSVITKYVNNIENELGLKIFVRSNKSRDLQLTDEGRSVIEAMRRIQDDYNYMNRLVNTLKNKESSRIRIASQPRFGNLHEQTIFTDFIIKYPASQVTIIKEPADVIIRGIIAGKIDAAFVTFHSSVRLNELFGDASSQISATYITSETEMYAGISDKYLPGINELNLKDLEDFTFVFPFPDEKDEQSVKAAESWKKIAGEKNMKLKYRNLQGYDATVFELARREKIAVTTTQVPKAKHEGIKFVRILDWTGRTDLYFLHKKNNNMKPVKELTECTEEYKRSL